MLLSIDWDAFSGTRELVFDAPIWGTPDREYDRLAAWRVRADKRGGGSWAALAADFPLYGGWQQLAQYAGIPSWVALSHAEAWQWLEFFEVQDVLNIDSHHDLGNLSGDPARVRPGNWAGLALQTGRIRSYTCQYPAWHKDLPVAEGFDLERTCSEIKALLPPETLERVHLTRADTWPDPQLVKGLLLVQSPAWTNPDHDGIFHGECRQLQAKVLTLALERPYLGETNTMQK